MRGFDDDHNTNAPLVRMAMTMGIVMVAILAIVCVLNRNEGESGHQVRPTISPDNIMDSGEDGNAPPVPEQQTELTLSGDDRTSDELDIWDEDYIEVLHATPTSAPNAATQEKDITTDGYHTRITYADGTEEWVMISSLIKKNNYEPSGFSYQRPIMSYYEDDVKISYAGASISAGQNYVDYIKLRRAGIEFVMLRVGLRGDNGEFEVDETFGQNMKDAVDAGMDVGIWFFSEALSKEEALEEAQKVIECLEDYEITYPVAFVMGEGEGKTENLTKTERTGIARAFCDALAEAGYVPMLGANKEYLIMKFDLTKLSDIAVWLLESGDLPDYPYSFTMWSYSGSEAIEGIAGDAQLCISFQDYGR